MANASKNEWRTKGAVSVREDSIPDILTSRQIFARNQRIIELCKFGFNCQQIGNFIGLTRSRVRQILAAFGLKAKGRKVTVKCGTCEKAFTKFSSQIIKNKRSFCSHECANKARRGSLELPCSACGAIVPRWPSRLVLHKRVFCSQQCYFSVRQDGRYKPWRQGQRRARQIVTKYFPLEPAHVVHHEDRDNGNNALSNLRVFANQADHMAYHHGVTQVVPLWDGRLVQA